MTTDTNVGHVSNYATTDTSLAQAVDAQTIGRDLFFHRYIYRPYESSADVNPMIHAAWDVFNEQSRINDYVVLLTSALLHDVGYVPKSLEGEGFSEDFKYLARHVSRNIELVEGWRGAQDVHDYREAGLTMDWQRAEELCRKMMEK